MGEAPDNTVPDGDILTVRDLDSYDSATAAEYAMLLTVQAYVVGFNDYSIVGAEAMHVTV